MGATIGNSGLLKSTKKPLPSEGYDIKPDPWDTSECRNLSCEDAHGGVCSGKDMCYCRLSDDTLYFEDWSNNEKNLMCILKGFEMVSGLKINFNKSKALIGKWWWRYRVDHDALWCRVVRIFYGADGGMGGREWARSVSRGVWGDIIKVGDGLVRLGIKFSSSFHRKVEDVAGRWVDGEWKWVWGWTREPGRRGEGELEELESTLHNIIIDSSCRDTWKWSLAENGIFSVRVLSTLVDEKNLDNGGDRKTTLLNKIVSKKIIVFVWRALCRRLSVRVELDKKGIDIPNILCPMCDETMETIDHALVLCNKSMRILLIQKLGRVLFSPNRQLFGDTIQLENVVSTISQEYLLEFTSEYGIPEDLHSELPGSEDMIMDFLEGKDGCHLANDWGRTRSGRSSVEYKPNGFVRPNPQPKPVQGKDWDSVSCVIVETATTTKVIQEPVLEKEVAAMGPPVNKRRRQRGTDEVEANAPPKVLRKDHATSHPV
ncbi:RNA-directed DNA polymerase, eukaryota, reverse transcriptase zinc-binding domain protein [Tanacetum coccineum]|uniref:RNA-directed DNA polymerase, eukaryota, reverse transcriptase zinc-binding domain protein n=1 Tax=Tanacetum coccineum TaxID=301880 RepID=A0ABQ5BIM4_9ASTR